jgi:hypothetical protein
MFLDITVRNFTTTTETLKQARARHNCHLSLPGGLWRQEIFAQQVNRLTVRLLRVRRSSMHVAHPRPFQNGDHHAHPQAIRRARNRIGQHGRNRHRHCVLGRRASADDRAGNHHTAFPTSCSEGRVSAQRSAAAAKNLFGPLARRACRLPHWPARSSRLGLLYAECRRRSWSRSPSHPRYGCEPLLTFSLSTCSRFALSFLKCCNRVGLGRPETNDPRLGLT